MEDLIHDFSKKLGIKRREISDQEILERCLYPMVNEGAMILEEGVAQRASDIDVIWVNGYGWPVYRGGPMFWADSIGLDEVVSAYDRYSSLLGSEDWTAADSLRTMASGGKKVHGIAGFNPRPSQAGPRQRGSRCLADPA